MALQVYWSPTPGTMLSYGRNPDVTVPSRYDLITEVVGRSNFTTTPPPTGFVHPGVYVSLPQLDFVKAKIAAGAQPWTSEYSKMLAAKPTDFAGSANFGRNFSSLSWVPTPIALVGRGTTDEGASDEQADSVAAFTHALIWYYTGNRASAQMANRILNAWSSTLQDHKFDLTNYSDGHLQASWTGSIFPRAAEIMRHTFTAAGGETALNVQACEDMFTRAFVNHVKDGWSGGGANWLTSMCEATMNIAIFNDDQVLFDRAVLNWRRWVKSVIWMTGDVNRWAQLVGLPISPRMPDDAPQCYLDKSSTTPATMQGYWKNPTSWPSGLETESGRDPWHTAMGTAALHAAAETARYQGVDLYGEERTRVTTCMEVTNGWLHDVFIDGIKPPTTGPTFPFPTSFNWGASTNAQRTTGVLAWNHYKNRLGASIPNTDALIADYILTTNYRVTVDIAYEPLTHYGVP